MKEIAIAAQRQDEFGQTSTSRFILRVLIFGSLLIALNCYWIISAENRVVWELTDFSDFPTDHITLFDIAGVKQLLKRALLPILEAEHELHIRIVVWRAPLFLFH